MPAGASFTANVIDLIPRLRAYARSLTRNHADADDLVQETLTKALRYHQQFQEGTQLKAWLFTIMRNTHFTAIKKYTREQPGAADCVADSVTVLPDHDIILAHKEILAAVDRLPTQYREMLTLVVILGESYENAAVICDCAVGTVKSRVNRARRMVVEDLTSRGKTGKPARDAVDGNLVADSLVH
jgi:RNA polymerase sigma-70 factor (ECF subfamily)